MNTVDDKRANVGLAAAAVGIVLCLTGFYGAFILPVRAAEARDRGEQLGEPIRTIHGIIPWAFGVGTMYFAALLGMIAIVLGVLSFTKDGATDQARRTALIGGVLGGLAVIGVFALPYGLVSLFVD